MNQLVPRTFTALVDIDNDSTIELNSLKELVKHLPEGIEYKDRRNTTNIYSDVTYYLQQSQVIRGIRITEIVDEHYFDEYENICYLDTTVEGIDVNNGEELSIPLYKARGNTHLVSDFKSLFPTSVPSNLIYKLEIHSLNPSDYSQLALPLENKDTFVCEYYYSGILSRTVVLGTYCESVIESHKDYLAETFPILIETCESYRNRKVTVHLKALELDEFIFICENFIAIGNEGEVKPHTPIIQDKRMEYLPRGPYYHFNCYTDRVEEVRITSISPIIEWDCDAEVIVLGTCVEYIDIRTKEESAHFSTSCCLPPLFQENLYLLINPNPSKEEQLLLYKYPYETRVEAPLNYPFKYIYPS